MTYRSIIVFLVYFFKLSNSTFHIERLVDTKANWQRKNSPYYALDMFANPGGCSFLNRALCDKFGATCQGLFSCCYCECPMWSTFVSLPSRGCKSGNELKTAMKNLGVDCQFLSVEMNHGIPSFKEQKDFESGLAITLPTGKVGGINLKNPSTRCSALRLFYINRDGNERLISDNRCSGYFRVERDLSTDGWILKWNSKVDASTWKKIMGMLLKLEIKCSINVEPVETFVSCMYAKVAGRYDDEEPMQPLDDSWCSPKNITPPPSTTEMSKTRPATSHSTLPSSSSALPNTTAPAGLGPKERQTRSVMPIVGGAIGAIVLLLILALLIFILVRRRKSRKGNQYDAAYTRPIIDYRDSASRGSTDPRYRIDRKLPDRPVMSDDAEYAEIDDTKPINGAEYACADAVFPKVSFRKPPPTYQESTNPYYRPASDIDYKTGPSDGQERDNVTYIPSLPSAPPNFYEDPSCTLTSTLPSEYESTLAGSLTDLQGKNPVYEDPSQYEDMSKQTS